jgi:hypothetical protein
MNGRKLGLMFVLKSRICSSILFAHRNYEMVEKRRYFHYGIPVPSGNGTMLTAETDTAILSYGPFSR